MIKSNYLYDIDYESIGNYSCEEYGCNDEGICRCYTIEEVDINSVNLSSISKDIYSQLFPNNDITVKRDNKINTILNGYDKVIIDKYCIHRILVINKIYNSNSWDPKWDSDYYGDEIISIDIKKHLLKIIDEQINTVVSMDSISEKIEYVLNLEYGSILPKIKNKTFSILEVDKNDIVFGQKNHLERVMKEEMKFYSDVNYQLPRGIVYKDGNKWRVIDGYHRISKSTNNKINIIAVI